MGRLGIDMAYAALPRYGLAFSSALRACNACTARMECAWRIILVVGASIVCPTDLP
jgi:hypothetical protein